MAYSTDIRVKALEHCKNGLTDEQVAAKTGVSKHTVASWKKLLVTTGSLEKKKVKRKSGTPYKYTPEKIGALLDKSRTSKTVTAAKDGKAQDVQKAPKQPNSKDTGSNGTKGAKKKKPKAQLKL